MASIMAGLPKVIASRPVDRRRSRPRPHATALDAQCQTAKLQGQALTLTFSFATFGAGTPPAMRSMARPPRVFGPGLLYHVIARGNRRETVFFDHSDYETYLRRLAVYRARYAVTLHAYCLMPNHVHLVLGTAALPLDRFMQCLQQSYTQRFNRRYAQVGHVFQGRYKAFPCATDEYLVTLVRYVHLNPVRAGLAAHAEDYPYSGHRAYLGEMAAGLVDPTLVLGLVGGTSGYVRLVAGDPVDIEPRGGRRPRAHVGLHTHHWASALRVLARGLRVHIDVLHGAGRGRSGEPGAGGGRLRTGPPPGISPDGRRRRAGSEPRDGEHRGERGRPAVARG